jgi:hypothetical protein
MKADVAALQLHALLQLQQQQHVEPLLPAKQLAAATAAAANIQQILADASAPAARHLPEAHSQLLVELQLRLLPLPAGLLLLLLWSGQLLRMQVTPAALAA